MVGLLFRFRSRSISTQSTSSSRYCSLWADGEGTSPGTRIVNSTSRRQFLTLLGATGLSAAIRSPIFAASTPPQEPFTFLFLTDAHLQPELNGVIGTDMAF